MDLPNDILLDILTRLPIKSLCHIRSVSKTSLSIVDNPFFAKLRLLNPVVEGPQLMLLTQTSSFIPSHRSRFALQSFNYKLYLFLMLHYYLITCLSCGWINLPATWSELNGPHYKLKIQFYLFILPFWVPGYYFFWLIYFIYKFNCISY